MATATKRRTFALKDAKPGVFLTNEEALYEVVRVRGISPTGRAQGHAAVKLLDCALEAARDPAEEAEVAKWVPLAVAKAMHVVEPSSS